MTDNSRHIAFCINEAYAAYIAVTIKSIAENNKHGDICIHIFTDYISIKWRKRLQEVVDDYDNISLHIYKTDDTQLKGLKTGRWTIYTWYRLLIPEILSPKIKRILYLDADTIVMSDLSELFSIDLNGKAIAAVLDPQTIEEETYVRCDYDSEKQYVCAGVMMMNLDYWRTNKLSDKVIKWAQTNNDRIKYPDQDAINHICQDAKIILPLRFGFMRWFLLNNRFYRTPFLEQLRDGVDNPGIIHYVDCAPWLKQYFQHIYHQEWIVYNRMLRHPVKRKSVFKGLLPLKIAMLDMFHLKHNDQILTKEKVKKWIEHAEKLRGAEMSTIHIAFCINEAYAPYITVPIKSIGENHKSSYVVVHILTDYISKCNSERLADVVMEYEHINIEMHIVDDSLLKSLKTTAIWPVHAWFRILLPDIIAAKVDRILYLDADTLVTDDLGELFTKNMTDKAIAGVLDIQNFFDKTYKRCGYESRKQYICSGVLLLNLDYWREHNLTDKIVNWAKLNSDRIKFPDQDAINYICRDTKIVLPLRYGFMHCFCDYDFFYGQTCRDELKECIKHPAIIHFCGCPPWGKEYRKHILHHRWMQYNRMLRNPVKRTYQVKGLKRIKVMIWDLLHLYHGREQLTVVDVIRKLQK